jgi:hypothetical protein
MRVTIDRDSLSPDHAAGLRGKQHHGPDAPAEGKRQPLRRLDRVGPGGPQAVEPGQPEGAAKKTRASLVRFILCPPIPGETGCAIGTLPDPPISWDFTIRRPRALEQAHDQFWCPRGS